MIGDRKNFPKEGFLAVKFPKTGMDGHLVVESIPPRYAREITHLFVGAIYHREKKKKTLVLPDTLPLRGGLEDYGKHLTSLRTLVISYQVPECNLSQGTKTTNCHTIPFNLFERQRTLYEI
mmetsp:Transcript_39644/g.95713  ORF Transcript_39644/g.95713 Transcript_39644/m.95713 type:complete len:121 (+) Transcript_39644:28-390(+)